MNALHRGARAAVAAGALVAAIAVAAGSHAAAADPGWAVIGGGPDQVHNAPNPFGSSDVTVLARSVGGSGVQVRLSAQDVAAAGERFGAHVHTSPCGSAAGASGGHYLNPDASGSLRHREIWLDFTVNADGRGDATATRDWTLSGARSVVIHANTTDHHGAAGTRLACIDVDFDLVG